MNIFFGTNFQACKEKLHIHEDNVREAVIHYDKTQTLSMDGLEIILYTKNKLTTQSFLVVCGNIAGNNYIVQWAFSIQWSQIEYREKDEPLILIQQFALKYGMTIRMGTQLNRFILKESFPISTLNESEITEVINPMNHSFFYVQYLKIKESKGELVAQCALAFCIDSDEYLNAEQGSNGGIGISIAPQLKTKLTPLDFMSTKGTMTFWKPYSELGQGKSGYIFRVSFPGYYFEAGFTGNELYLQRNEYRIAMSFDSTNKSQELMNCYLMWEPTRLHVIILDPSYGKAISMGYDTEKEVQKRTRIMNTPAIIPPNSILEWARKLNILPLKTYQSREDFYQAVVMAIQSVQDKISSSNMYDAFWDFTYNGSRIESRIPKRETDIVPTVHGLLFDISLLKNFQIYPEHPLAGGKLDFLVSGYLVSEETANVCVEFKHAHSADIEDGLIKQLPAYMQAKGCNFGIYAVLYFRGQHFDRPGETIPDLEFRLKNLASSVGLIDINVIAIDLSRPISPSKL